MSFKRNSPACGKEGEENEDDIGGRNLLQLKRKHKRLCTSRSLSGTKLWLETTNSCELSLPARFPLQDKRELNDNDKSWRKGSGLYQASVANNLAATPVEMLQNSPDSGSQHRSFESDVVKVPLDDCIRSFPIQDYEGEPSKSLGESCDEIQCQLKEPHIRSECIELYLFGSDYGKVSGESISCAENLGQELLKQTCHAADHLEDRRESCVLAEDGFDYQKKSKRSDVCLDMLSPMAVENPHPLVQDNEPSAVVALTTIASVNGDLLVENGNSKVNDGFDRVESSAVESPDLHIDAAKVSVYRGESHIDAAKVSVPRSSSGHVFSSGNYNLRDRQKQFVKGYQRFISQPSSNQDSLNAGKYVGPKKDMKFVMRRQVANKHVSVRSELRRTEKHMSSGRRKSLLHNHKKLSEQVIMRSTRSGRNQNQNSTASKYSMRPRRTNLKYTYPTVPLIGRKKIPWTLQEETVLTEGVQKFSNSSDKNIPWKDILQYGGHVFESTRTAVDLKDKWRNVLKAMSRR